MPRKIAINEKNKKMAIEIVHKLADNNTYEQIAKEYGIPKDFIYCLIKTYKPILGINGVISKYDSLKLSGEIEQVVRDYLNGKTSYEISQHYKVSDRTVISWLLRENVNIKDRGRVTKVNPFIFDNIDSEIKAYTLGLITADGSVSQKNNNITICLTKEDKYLLDIINNNLLDGLGTIIISHKEDKKPRYVLSFSGKRIKERLKDFNIVPNKSHTLENLSDLIPEEYYHHYIRGLFDGDGVCSYYTSHHKIKKVRIGYCSYKKEFVENYRDFLNQALNLPKNKLFNTGGCWQCSWAAFDDVQKFTNYIYKDATIFLGRKKKKLFDYVNTEVN